MSALLGLSGARRNACAAICIDGEIGAACEQERLTRVRRDGIRGGRLPIEAIEQVLAIADRRRHDVSSYVLAERAVRLPRVLPSVEVDHHEAHAAIAFLTSPYDRAAVVVCDRSGRREAACRREISVWCGNGVRLQEHSWRWSGIGLASLYTECARILADGAAAPEPRLEALAHVGRADEATCDRIRRLFRLRDGRLELERGWRAALRHGDRAGRADAPAVADAVQRRIGELLLALLTEIRAAVDVDTLCLGGGLFYNTYLTTLVRCAGIFDRVFVPINPGNAGLAVGATLMLSAQADGATARRELSPFLGPSFDDEAIKRTLDGCKLSYAFVRESQAVDAAVAALAGGALVGWFQGRMEWGHRALGHRSILADPKSPYVLDNLNCFLRKRERWRPFGVSACADAVPSLFAGPPQSTFMEYEYQPRDDRFRHVMPPGASALRVQTVGADAGPFWTLHKRMEQATGTGVLVNTSFNGFHEPIACTPGDAIRVFYGTGLDMLVMGRFILQK